MERLVVIFKTTLSPQHMFFVVFKARYGGSNMKKIDNGGRLLIFYMMEGIKKVN